MSFIAFRLDDIAADMNWERFNLFKQIFLEHDIKPLIGVIPDNQDASLRLSSAHPDFWPEVRALVQQGWSVAQHGYQHIYCTLEGGLLRLNDFSEFAGLPYSVQLEKIQQGQRVMAENGVFSDIWMSPAHSYDKQTLAALNVAGFRYVSDGYALFPYDYLGLRFIPCQMAVPRKLPLGLVTVCIHANYASDHYIHQIADFIKAYRRHIISFQDALEFQPFNICSRQIESCVLRLLRPLKKIFHGSISSELPGI